MEWTEEQRDQINGYVAPDGYVWVCAACGKTSPERTGRGSQYGWDVSCFLNAVLVKDTDIVFDGGRVSSVEAVAFDPRSENIDESAKD